MLYWLFSTGRELIQSLLIPTLCSVACLLPLALVSFGIGIQRRAGGQPLDQPPSSMGQRIARWGIFGLPNVALVMLYISLLSNFALGRSAVRQKPLTGLLAVLVGGTPSVNQPRLLMVGCGLFFALFLLNIALWQGMKNGGWWRETLDRWRRPTYRRGEMGSAHFCTVREYRRFRVMQDEGVTLLGAFWGERRRRVDFGWGKFALSAEDAARGILTFGGPGSGKTQGVILPTIADRMTAGHSLIVADPQGEIKNFILSFAKVTGHLIVIHDPTSATTPRYNLAQEIRTVSDARAIADVLIPSRDAENKFWTDSAAALLAACLIRFDNLGDIYNALNDLKRLAVLLGKAKDDASLLANSFIASVNADGKVAASVVATLATALTGWASGEVRENTNASDFDAAQIVARPVVVILTCPGRMREVYASYLGATLRKLMLDLDTIGEQHGGPLPMPVGIILDEFPTLGKLDSLVADVNLVRKRRISILIGAQSKAQFHLHYGDNGTQALLTGLATQIVYGGCDPDTAAFYSRASGISTSDTDPDPQKASYRQRPLLTMDEIIAPEDGNCTIFARYIESNYAGQVILHAQLTRLYERLDWRERLTACAHRLPNLMRRGIDLERETRSTHRAATSPIDADDTGLNVVERPLLKPNLIRQVRPEFVGEAIHEMSTIAAQAISKRKSAELGVNFSTSAEVLQRRRAKSDKQNASIPHD